MLKNNSNNIGQSFPKWEQKDSLVEECVKAEQAAANARAELNQLYAEKIMDIMNSHNTREVVLYDDSRSEYFHIYDEKYDDFYNQRYYKHYQDGVEEFWICRLAIIDGELKMRVQDWNEEYEEFDEEEDDWRCFSEIDRFEDIQSKENIIRYLEESDEAFDLVKKHPKLQVLE